MQNNESTLDQSNQGNPLERALDSDNSPPVLSRFGKYVIDSGVRFSDYLFSHLPAGLRMGLGFVAAYGALAFLGPKRVSAEASFININHIPDDGGFGSLSFELCNDGSDPAYSSFTINEAELVMDNNTGMPGNWYVDQAGPPLIVRSDIVGDWIGGIGEPQCKPFTLFLFVEPYLTQLGGSLGRVDGESPWEGLEICAPASRNPADIIPGDYNGDGSTGTAEDCQALADCINKPPATQFCLDGGDTDFDCQIDYFDPACDAKAILTTSDWGLIVMALLTCTAGTIAFRRTPTRRVAN